jgi:putative protein kinase ArgK-like GTPase of G3E family
VLVTTAATGAGVPELVAAIDRHRALGGSGAAETARLKRAEAQVWAVLVDRLHERVRDIEGIAPARAAGDAPASATGAPAASELLKGVAAHEVDPYAAADWILDRLIGGSTAR